MAVLTLLATSQRLPAGLLSGPAWRLLASSTVLAGAESALVTAVRDAGSEVRVEVFDAVRLAAVTKESGAALWLLDGADPAEFAAAVTAADPGVTVEELVGSWDPPGAQLLDVVAVMDRLRSPGGCPWDAEQTHQTLAPYLLEEAYEAYDALVDQDLAGLREELGDVLLQVAFHSRLAQELPPGQRWSIDDVAAGLVTKLVTRHPHVFASTVVADAEEVHENWEQIKRREKARESSMDGIARTQPALALVAKMLSRATRAGVEASLPAAEGPAEQLGQRLFDIVAQARTAGLDAEAALRAAAIAYADAVRAAERS
ncbi:nucleoside triphosphate pyrophosphohydrolase [Fodinicola feengrottensis]|uniref:Nucleoside triphosphate pyrophosphohydrolase n=1 Tax=Fodinicola feengrottensis TaxID=435914 RepID=A0ABN2HGP8_9ACTN